MSSAKWHLAGSSSATANQLAIFRRASPAVRRIFGRRFDANVDSRLIFSLKDAIERLR